MSVGFTAFGGEFMVHDTTLGVQGSPNITSFEDGSYLIVWNSENIDSDLLAITGQLFNADGSKNGGEFQINTVETGSQHSPNVATLTNGGFVVVWMSDHNETGNDVYGQKFNADGTKNGSEFSVNTYTSDNQFDPTVTGLSDGGFVVTWWSIGQEDGLLYTVHGQKYDNTGATSGSEFKVGSNTVFADYHPDVYSFDDGGFVVAYQSHSRDGDGTAIYAQLFNAAGAAVGAEFQVNTNFVGEQHYPAVTTFADGSFVIAWTSGSGDGDGDGVFAQRYDAVGVKVGAEFQVNTTTDYDQREVDISTLADGGFVVVWAGDVNTTSHYNVYAQRYDANGDAIGVETQINTFTVNYQFEPVVEGLADGGFIISWESNTQDGGGYGTYAQRFAAELWGTSGKDSISDKVGADWIDGQGGNDTLRGKTGKDTIYGGDGKDKIYGGDQADKLYGEKSRDIIEGGNGNDKIKGGGGADIITGGVGKDTMTGGSGDDVFVFTDLLDSKVGKVDVIKDFGNGDDILDLRFTGLLTRFEDHQFKGEGVLAGEGAEIVYEVIGGDSLIHVDIDGNGVSDMDILLKNVTTLSLTDFSLEFGPF